MPRTRKMLVLAVEGCQSLDVLGPVEVFHHVSIEVPNAYQVSIVGPSATETITTDSGQFVVTVAMQRSPCNVQGFTQSQFPYLDCTGPDGRG